VPSGSPGVGVPLSRASALSRRARASYALANERSFVTLRGPTPSRGAFVGQQLTVYCIAQRRGFAEAAAVLGEGYAAVLERDGWAPYRGFTHARHQTCLAHLLGRCRELLADAERGGVQATNWRAEQAIRPAVVSRKAWGGNRTWAGAGTWQVLASVLRTAHQQDRDPASY
jgi:hypothetical protein